MNKPPVVWLPSYPRSGNTMLRTILWNCFGLKSASIYPNDLGGNKELENYVGHIEQDDNHRLYFPQDSLPLIKTHEVPQDEHPAIYVVRDGRAASVSLWQFYENKIPLEEVIKGNHRFGTWSNHVQKWMPKARPNTLLIKYEEMIADASAILETISDFLSCKIKNTEIPNREEIANIDGKWVKTKEDWESCLNDDLLSLFNETNFDSMKEMKYVS